MVIIWKYYRIPLLVPTKQILLFKKRTNLVKRLVQGPLGLDLHICSFIKNQTIKGFLIINVDGGIH